MKAGDSPASPIIRRRVQSVPVLPASAPSVQGSQHSGDLHYQHVFDVETPKQEEHIFHESHLQRSLGGDALAAMSPVSGYLPSSLPEPLIPTPGVGGHSGLPPDTLISGEGINRPPFPDQPVPGA